MIQRVLLPLILIGICMLACGERQDTRPISHGVTQPQPGQPDTTYRIRKQLLATVDPEFFPAPHDILLDTLLTVDSSRKLITGYILPRWRQSPDANKLLDEMLDSVRQQYLARIDRELQQDSGLLPPGEISNQFTASAINAHSDNGLLSYCIGVETYEAYAPHPAIQYLCLNYDLRTNQHIRIQEYFDFASPHKEHAFRKLVYGCFPETEKNEMMESALMSYKFHDTPFNIECDSIAFNFGDYTLLGYISYRVKCSKKALAPMIRGIYQHR